MLKGYTVMVYDRSDGDLLKVLKVGIDDPAEAIRGILIAHPELQALHLVAGGAIEPTSVAYLELQPGEIRTA